MSQSCHTIGKTRHHRPANCSQRLQYDRDIIAYESAQHVRNVIDDCIHIYKFWKHDLLPAECKQLLDQRRCASSCTLDIQHVLRDWIFGKKLLQRNLAVTGDDTQDIVEVVCNSA